MDKIVFSWREYLRRDVSLFEEVEFAPIRVLLKYIYPGDLVERLPLPCRFVCESLAEKVQTLHANLYSEEAIQELYHKDSRSLKRKRITIFIENSLHRLLEPNEGHTSHALFTRKMIPELVEFFVDLMKTPATTVVSPDLTPLRLAADRYRADTSELRSEIEVSQARFLFHYFLSYLRKLVECCDVGGACELRLRSRDDVVSSFSKGNVEDLFSPLVTSPKISDFEIDDGRCLVLQCAVCEPQRVAETIFGAQVLSAIDEQRSKPSVLEMTTNFIDRHRKICIEMAPWLDPVIYSKLEKSPAKSLAKGICTLANKLSAALYVSFPGLYTRFNLEAAYRHFVSKLPLKRDTSKEEFLESIAIEFNPEPLPFIDDLGSHLRPCRGNRLSDFQQALFYNTMYFYYHYATHWFRRIALIERLNGKDGPLYSLKWRSEEERKELLGKSAFKATNSEVHEERRRLYAEKHTTSDDSGSGGSQSRVEAEECSQGPSTSIALTKEVSSEKYSESAQQAEEEPTGGDAITNANKKEKRKRKKSIDTEEIANEQPNSEDTEKAVKKSKKRKSDDSGAGGSQSLEECSQDPSTSTAQTKVVSCEKDSEADQPVEEEETTGGDATSTDTNKQKKTKKLKKSTNSDDAEVIVKKSMKRKKEERPSESDGGLEISDVVPAKENSKSAGTAEEEELTGGDATTTDTNKKKKAKKRKNSKDTVEIASEKPNSEDTEKAVKKTKKRKKEKRPSESDGDLQIIAVLPPKEGTPVVKRNRKKSCEVIELSSDEEPALLPDDAWELKWKSAADRLAKDENVPALASLTLQTVLENSRRLRFQWRAMGL